MRPLESLTMILGHISGENLETGRTMGLHTIPAHKEGIVIITGPGLEEGLGYSRNMNEKVRTVETLLREQLDLPRQTAVEVKMRPPGMERKLVLPEEVMEKLSGLTEQAADRIGRTIKAHPAWEKVAREAEVTIRL
jgi:hypothetical protein